MAAIEITKDIPIKDLAENYIFSIHYLAKKRIICIPCGDRIWGTLEEVAKTKGFSDDEIKTFVDDLRRMQKEYAAM